MSTRFTTSRTTFIDHTTTYRVGLRTVINHTLSWALRVQYHYHKPGQTNISDLPLKDPDHGPPPWFARLVAVPYILTPSC